MGSARFLAVAGAVVFLAGGSALAADMQQGYPQPYPQPQYAPPQQYLPPPPPPQYVPPPQPIAFQQPRIFEFSGWYLRGDIGVSSQRFEQFDFTQTNPAFVWPASWKIEQKDIKDSTFFALGVGYTWNSWLRFDVTGEYRASTKFKALGSYTEFCPGGVKCFDLYDGDHQASVFLANVYLDLGTWWCLTPFVGLGLGSAYHTFDGFTDVGYISDGTTGFGFASKTGHDWTFAWQAQAGLAYDVTKNLKLELAYRYLDLGSPNTNTIACTFSGCATSGPRAYYTLTDLTARELKLGVRWMLDIPEPLPPPPQYIPPPLVRKG